MALVPHGQSSDSAVDSEQGWRKPSRPVRANVRGPALSRRGGHAPVGRPFGLLRGGMLNRGVLVGDRGVGDGDAGVACHALSQFGSDVRINEKTLRSRTASQPTSASARQLDALKRRQRQEPPSGPSQAGSAKRRRRSMRAAACSFRSGDAAATQRARSASAFPNIDLPANEAGAAPFRRAAGARDGRDPTAQIQRGGEAGNITGTGCSVNERLRAEGTLQSAGDRSNARAGPEHLRELCPASAAPGAELFRPETAMTPGDRRRGAVPTRTLRTSRKSFGRFLPRVEGLRKNRDNARPSARNIHVQAVRDRPLPHGPHLAGSISAAHRRWLTGWCHAGGSP